VYVITSGSTSQVVTVPPGWRRLRGTQDPGVNNGQAVTSLTLAAKQGIILVKA
jgi:hypothetical protein